MFVTWLVILVGNSKAAIVDGLNFELHDPLKGSLKQECQVLVVYAGIFWCYYYYYYSFAAIYTTAIVDDKN